MLLTWPSLCGGAVIQALRRRVGAMAEDRHEVCQSQNLRLVEAPPRCATRRFC